MGPALRPTAIYPREGWSKTPALDPKQGCSDSNPGYRALPKMNSLFGTEISSKIPNHLSRPYHTFSLSSSSSLTRSVSPTYPQIESKQTSMESRWALVREQPLESLYTVWSKESMREAWCSVPAKRGAHLVNRGSTAVQRYRLRAKAMSVALRAAWKGIVRAKSHLHLAGDNS